MFAQSESIGSVAGSGREGIHRVRLPKSNSATVVAEHDRLCLCGTESYEGKPGGVYKVWSIDWDTEPEGSDIVVDAGLADAQKRP